MWLQNMDHPLALLLKNMKYSNFEYYNLKYLNDEFSLVNDEAHKK